MDLELQTKKFIREYVLRYFHKAVSIGAKVSEVEYVGANMYKIYLGKSELTFMGTAEGTAQQIGVCGDIFEENEGMKTKLKLPAACLILHNNKKVGVFLYDLRWIDGDNLHFGCSGFDVCQFSLSSLSSFSFDPDNTFVNFGVIV